MLGGGAHTGQESKVNKTDMAKMIYSVLLFVSILIGADTQTVTRCVANLAVEGGPCSCSEVGFSNCYDCTFPVDGSTGQCNRCENGAYLHDGACYSNCSSYPWTYERGSPSASVGRTCDLLANVVSSVTCHTGTSFDRPAYQCRVAQRAPPLSGCIANTEFEVTPFFFANVATARNSVSVCATATICEVGEVVEQHLTATTDRVCTEGPTESPDERCELGVSYEVIPSTPTTNRVCRMGTECNVPHEYESTAMTLTSDRMCSTTSECNTTWLTRTDYLTSPAGLTFNGSVNHPNDQFIATSVTATTDRQCQRIRECQFCTDGPGCEYLMVAPTATTDSTCAFITECREHEHEVVAPTFWSNRGCEVNALEATCSFDLILGISPTNPSEVSEPFLPSISSSLISSTSQSIQIDDDLFTVILQLDTDSVTIHAIVRFPDNTYINPMRDFMATFVMPFGNRFLLYVDGTFLPITGAPTFSPTPSDSPSATPTREPTATPTIIPTESAPTATPTMAPTTSLPTTMNPSQSPSYSPTQNPQQAPTARPSSLPSSQPSPLPTNAPSAAPSAVPTFEPTSLPSSSPSAQPTTIMPTRPPTNRPTQIPTGLPTSKPTTSPTVSPTSLPTIAPTISLYRQISLQSIGADEPSALSDGSTLGALIGGLAILILLVGGFAMYSSRNRGVASISGGMSSQKDVENNAYEETREIVPSVSPIQTYSPIPASKAMMAPETKNPPITVSDVGERVAVVDYGTGTLRYYGKHAYKPGFRCGVELDSPRGFHTGTVEGFVYFECAEQHGVLVDPRKVVVVKDTQMSSSVQSQSTLRFGGTIGDVARPSSNPMDVQLQSLRDQMDMAYDVYASIPRKRPDADFSSGHANTRLNRYLDILPYEDTRVTLSSSQSYINANFVNFESDRRSLNTICAQGPTPETVLDMWQMIWDQKVEVIVMLTSLVEGNRIKCSQYWPSAGVGDYIELGDYSIECTKPQRDFGQNVTVLELSVTLRGGGSRKLHHVQFGGWPDHGVPQSPTEFLRLVEVVNALEDEKTQNGPTVVHCSAGVGRTGVFLLVSVILDKLKQKIVPDFTAILQELRRQRMLLVQMPQQYVFSFQAAIAALTSNSWRYD